MDYLVTEVKLPASEISRLPIKVLMYYWKQKKGKAIVTLILVGGILSLWRVGSIRQRYQETLISQQLDPRRQITKIDWKFLRQLKKLRRTCVPKFFCSETFHFILLTFLLLCRTYLSITIAEVVSSNAQALIDRQLYKFIFGVTQLGIIAIPTAIVNSALKYFTSTLSVYMRRRLTLYCHEHYLDSNNTFYRSLQLYPPENLAERITQDVDKFSVCVSDFYANSFKTLMDIVLLSRKLSQTVGIKGPILMFLYYFVTGVFLRSFMPSFSKLYTAQQRMEDNFRLSHAKLLNRAEEISFYHANQREKENINANFTQMFKNTFNILRLRAIVNAMDGWLTKYGATMMGYAVCAIPIFSNKQKRSTSDVAKEFLFNIQLLVHLSTAIGQLVVLFKKVLTLSACTNKIDQLFNIIHNLRQVAIPQSSPSILSSLDVKSNDKSNDNSDNNLDKKSESKVKKIKKTKATVAKNPDSESEILKENSEESDKEKNKEESDEEEEEEEEEEEDDEDDDDDENIIGTKKNFGDFIRFKNVTAITRSNRVLFKDLSFTVRTGSNLLIAGPPGCGKTMIFRLLNDLIPVYSGHIIKPFGGLKEIFFVPQKPHFFSGTLRDQIIYPHSKQDMMNNGKDDSLILQILEQLSLSFINRNNSLDHVGDWDIFFNITEKQRLSIARLIYHKPRFGIIDDCLNQISIDLEEKIYKTLADMSITVITVSNRRSVRTFHENFLIFDNSGNWELISRHQTERFNKVSSSPSANRRNN